jgi:hypothetical protein
VISVGAYDPNGLLEGQFNFESQAIDADDVEEGKCPVRTHQQDSAAMGMEYRNEADEDVGRAPQQIGGLESESHILLAIDGAERFLELVGFFQQRGKR